MHVHSVDVAPRRSYSPVTLRGARFRDHLPDGSHITVIVGAQMANYSGVRHGNVSICPASPAPDVHRVVYSLVAAPGALMREREPSAQRLLQAALQVGGSQCGEGTLKSVVAQQLILQLLSQILREQGVAGASLFHAALK
jgi:hypothetical protein